MDNLHKSKVFQLRELLKELSSYHSAQSSFALKFSKIYGKSINRNFVNRIMKGEILFERELYIYLDEAIQLAEDLINRFKIKRDKSSSKILIKSVLQDNSALLYLDEHISITDKLYEKGNMQEALELIRNLDKIVDSKKIVKHAPFICGNYYMIYAKVQMQFGVSVGVNNSMCLVNESIAIFNNLFEPEKHIQSLNLRGHILRQLESYDEALNEFTTIQKLIESLPMSNSKKEKYLTNINHQIGVTLINKIHKEGAIGLVGAAKQIFKDVNKKLQESENEIFAKLSLIREADLYVKSNMISEADSILGDFEDYCEISTLQQPQRAIFFRINSEKYAKINDVKNCLKNFKTAVTIAVNEGYQHELKQLQELFLKYDIIKNNLSEDFSILNPTWP
jgi:tetratricopeptide (TPR) repeat protein